MGIKWIKEKIENHQNVKSCDFPGDKCLDIIYHDAKGSIKKIRAYTPAPNEYLLGCDVIDKVYKLGVTVIVENHFCESSSAGLKYAKDNNIAVVSAKQFFYKVFNGVSF